eukprot:354234-Chlamydomonas_euryale.AAC.14
MDEATVCPTKSGIAHVSAAQAAYTAMCSKSLNLQSYSGCTDSSFSKSGQVCRALKSSFPKSGQVCRVPKSSFPKSGQVCRVPKSSLPKTGQVCRVPKRIRLPNCSSHSDCLAVELLRYRPADVRTAGPRQLHAAAAPAPTQPSTPARTVPGCIAPTDADESANASKPLCGHTHSMPCSICTQQTGAS